MDTTVPVVYGSYTLEYNCHIPRPQCSKGQTVVYLVYTTGGAFDLWASHSTNACIGWGKYNYSYINCCLTEHKMWSLWQYPYPRSTLNEYIFPLSPTKIRQHHKLSFVTDSHDFTCFRTSTYILLVLYKFVSWSIKNYAELGLLTDSCVWTLTHLTDECHLSFGGDVFFTCLSKLVVTFPRI